MWRNRPSSCTDYWSGCCQSGTCCIAKHLVCTSTWLTYDVDYYIITGRSTRTS
uniref:huwentoxin-IV family protein n=1 Tax=Thermoflexibacter ruber TaxID=1003 RepID=UPI00373FCB7F